MVEGAEDGVGILSAGSVLLLLSDRSVAVGSTDMDWCLLKLLSRPTLNLTAWMAA